MFNFASSIIPNNIFVIGAGGTGSRLIPLLAQFMRSITRGTTSTGWVESPNIWLIDDDVVEQKNILRQNFIEQDVGKHKALVLAERYQRAYGVNIIPVMERVTYNVNALHVIIDQIIRSINPEMTGNTRNYANQVIAPSMVIMCVDSVRARRDILNAFMTPSSDASSLGNRTFFIDAGNEDNFGQVSFFTPTISTAPEDYLSKNMRTGELLPQLITAAINTDRIPMDIMYYKDLIDTPAQGSCADLNQTLAINAIMATTIMGIVQNFYYRKPMNYNSVSLSLNGGNFTTHNTFNEFKRRSVKKREAEEILSGGLYVTEKDGTVNYLTFGRYLGRIPVLQMARDIESALVRERAAREAEARKVAEAEEMEERRRVILKAREEAEAAEAAAKKQMEEAKEIPEIPVTSTNVVSTEEITKPEPLPTTNVVPEPPVKKARVRKVVAAPMPLVGDRQLPPTVPQLTPVPRSQRVPTVLNVPEGWTATVGHTAPALLEVEDEDATDLEDSPIQAIDEL